MNVVSLYGLYFKELTLGKDLSTIFRKNNIVKAWGRAKKRSTLKVFKGIHTHFSCHYCLNCVPNRTKNVKCALKATLILLSETVLVPSKLSLQFNISILY